jgi:hypothetical protein
VTTPHLDCLFDYFSFDHFQTESIASRPLDSLAQVRQERREEYSERVDFDEPRKTLKAMARASTATDFVGRKKSAKGAEGREKIMSIEEHVLSL